MNDGDLVMGFLAMAALVWIWRVNARLTALESRLEQVTDPKGALDSLPPAARRALEAGDKIAAIREYRFATGADIKRAMGAIRLAQREVQQQGGVS